MVADLGAMGLATRPRRWHETAGVRAAVVLSLCAHALIALAIWGPAWWAARAGSSTPAIDINSELAPAKPEVETIGQGGVAAGASEATPVVPMQVALIDWPTPKPTSTPKPKPKPAVEVAALSGPNVAGALKDVPGPKRPPKPVEGAKPATAAPSADAALGGGEGVGAAGGAGPGVAPVLVAGIGNASFATGANLLAYAPPRHIVAVYVRLSLLRDTPWEPMVEAILRPMPDYRALLGKQAAGDKSASRLFDSILISTSSPRRVDATMLAVRPRVARDVVRRSVADGDKIFWRVVRGGAAGERLPSDGRVFLAPALDLMLLARVSELGDLMAPPTGTQAAATAATPAAASTAPLDAVPVPAPAPAPAPAASASSTIDTSVAHGALPGWLSQLMQLEAHVVANSPAGKAPLLMMTAAIKPSAKVGERLGTPGLALPTQMTLSVIMEATGFVVRGNLVFADAAAASAFAGVVIAKQAEAVGDPIAGLVLSRVGAKNALLNFSLQPTDRVLAFSTSISAVDAKKLLTLAALELASYFAEP
ncbi:MAG: hypothetical protein IPL79_19645 [Myxococcales bacterium]|nr:hypothetical protein [Myxococcales bacterium]